MNTLIIIGSNPSKTPYINYYISALTSLSHQYDVICWNRDNVEECLAENYYTFNYTHLKSDSKLKKIWAHWNFRNYVIRHIKRHHYDNVIIFTLQSAILFSDVLCRKFRRNFIFDIRDYSHLYNINIGRLIVDKCLNNSFANCISSPGFKQWLPKHNQYVISHNIHQDLVSNGLVDVNKNKDGAIKILTIGQIRDVEENFSIIESLGNNDKFLLTFIGVGEGIKELERRVVKKGYDNVFFKGRYDKECENEIVAEYDMINAYMPNNTLSSTLMSNRIYLSLLLGKPIIVTDDSTQASYVKKYKLGICINDTNNIKDEIISYWTDFDKNTFNQGRINFLNEIKSDINVFEQTVKEFINNTK